MIENRDLKQANILVVDDEPINLILMQEYFEDEGFVNVTYMRDSVMGFEFYKSQDVDMLLLDLKMPDIDGFEFMKKMQGLDKPRPPVLVLTASADNKTRDRVLKADAQGVISKPFNFDVVLLMVEKLIPAYWASGIS
ncbi:MAG: response regulator [Gammaproteobacteria bacterium]|nr:response regulator [Gammaproteobacteria bacterium]